MTPPHQKAKLVKIGIMAWVDGQKMDSRARDRNWSDFMAKKEKRAAIEQDLLDDLERQGKIGKYYIDQVNLYMSLWDVKNKLVEDLEKNGALRVRTLVSGSQTIENSKSTDQLLKVSDRMQKLLSFLVPDREQEADDDDEM